jgi:hypothetical protein
MSVESDRDINKNAIQLYRASGIVPQEITGVGKKSLDRSDGAEGAVVKIGSEGGLKPYLSDPDKSLKDLARGLGVGLDVILSLCKHFGIIKPSKGEIVSEKAKERWQDSESRGRLTPVHPGKLRQYHQDPDMEKKRTEGTKKANQKLDVRVKKSDAIKTLDKDPDCRKIYLEMLTIISNDGEIQERRTISLQEIWSEPKFREKQTGLAGEKITWLNKKTDQLQKAAKGIRRLHTEPESAEGFYLTTTQGYRKDIDYHAQSAGEANIARILKYTGREFYPKASVVLDVPDQYRDLFKFDVTQSTVDFIVEDPKENLVAYDLIAHPQEDPVEIAKAEMFKKQYPEIPLHVINTDLYLKLKKKFEKKINSSKDLCGWETSKDNLFTNPKKYTYQS